MMAAMNYIRARRYNEALNVLNGISNHNAAWYYYSSIANMGLGNNVTALDQIREEFAAYSCDDQKTLDTIREIHDRCGYVMDTHTAVAVNALEQYQQETGDRTPALVVSTASPFKFADSVLTALGREVPAGEFDCLRALSEVSGLAVPASLAQLEELPMRFEGAVRPQEMEHALLHALRKMDESM